MKVVMMMIKKMAVTALFSVALATCAAAGSYVDGTGDQKVDDPFVPASGSGLGGAAVVGGLALLVFALGAGSDDSSESSGTMMGASGTGAN